MTGIPGSPPDLRHVPMGCAFHLRCQFAFDACREHVPLLTTPGVVGVHIGNQRLETDSILAEGVQSKRSQQCLVACHLYNTEMIGEHMENALHSIAPEQRANRMNGKGNVEFIETGEGQNDE